MVWCISLETALSSPMVWWLYGIYRNQGIIMLLSGLLSTQNLFWLKLLTSHTIEERLITQWYRASVLTWLLGVRTPGTWHIPFCAGSCPTYVEFLSTCASLLSTWVGYLLLCMRALSWIPAPFIHHWNIIINLNLRPNTTFPFNFVDPTRTQYSKLNFDVSFIKDGSAAGIGGILSSNQGTMLLARFQKDCNFQRSWSWAHSFTWKAAPC